jgi:hypothetical protein
MPINKTGGASMSKYLVFWNVDINMLPTDTKERAAIAVKLDEMVKQEITEGKVSDWGVFIGGDNGYAVMEGNSADIYKDCYRYRPYVTFDIQEVLTIDQALEVAKARIK